MAFVVNFKPEALTSAKYYEVIRRLDEAGAGKFAGRICRFPMENPERLFVTYVFDSLASIEEFALILQPILEETGIRAGLAEISEIHNSIV